MVIELREDTGIKSISSLYSELKEVLEKESEIILDFKKVRRIDLAFAQLIMALNRESILKEKKFMLKSVSDDVRKQLFLAGFAE